MCFPAIHALLGKRVPKEEYGRFVSTINGACYAGTMVAMLLVAPITQHFRWPWVFYSFGIAGLLWTALFAVSVRWESDDSKEDRAPPREGEEMQNLALLHLLKSPYVWSLILVQFCCSWGYYVLLQWLPRMLEEFFKLNLSQNGWLSMMPYGVGLLCGVSAGFVSDWLAKHMAPRSVRLLMQTAAMLGASLGLLTMLKSKILFNFMLGVALSVASNQLTACGVQVAHFPIDTRVAGQLVAMGNTASCMGGLIGVAVTGAILETLGWPWIFSICIGWYLMGTLLWWTLGTATIPRLKN